MALTKEDLITKYTTQLTNVEAAIAKAEKQQEYALDDGQGKQDVTRAKLQTLYERQSDLENKIVSLEQGTSTSGYGRLR